MFTTGQSLKILLFSFKKLTITYKHKENSLTYEANFISYTVFINTR